jgi:GNAT superfamily N-acetyltransferase/predicted nucleic acid-binding protein
MATLRIVKSEGEGSRYIDRISEVVDANKDVFAFVPAVWFKASLAAGRLWILVDDGVYAGHLMFYGPLPTLKIQQLFVLPEHRGRRLARRLLDELIEHAEVEGYGSIRARVASDLPANSAWERLGFPIVRTVRGGQSTGRVINLRLRRIQPRGDQLHMFAMLEGTVERRLPIARGIPISRSRWYALDMNVWLDLVRRRGVFYVPARKLLDLAIKGRLRLRFTSEAVEEARRSSNENPEDQLLEVMKTWQALPGSDEAVLATLVDELRGIVFPGRLPSGRQAANEQSDLRHLAISIHQGANGFVTRDRDLLRRRTRILSRFGLEILMPTDLAEDDVQLAAPRTAWVHDLKVDKVAHWSDVREYARGVIGDGARLREPDHDDEIWTCSLAGDLVGLCYWHTQTRGDVEAFLHVSDIQESDARQRAFDVLLGLLVANSPSTSVFHRVVLRMDEDTASYFFGDLQRLGFLKTKEPDCFIRFVSGAPLDLGDWKLAKELVERETGSLSEWIAGGKRGPILQLKRDSEVVELDRFAIETCFGITTLTLGDRKAFYVPVKEVHSNELLPLSRRPSLFTSHDASFRVERVYFRSPRMAASIEPGDLLFFYVSGEIGEVLGVARCTASEILDAKEATERYRRLAVLDPSVVGDKVHCLAFDNYLPFKTPVTLAWLKAKGLEANNNFQTIARVPGASPGTSYLALLAEGLCRR